MSKTIEANHAMGAFNPRLSQLSVVVGAVAAALMLWAVAEPLLGINLRAPASGDAPNSDIGPVMVTIASLVPALLGWGLLVLLQRFTAHARTAWTVVGCVVLAISLFGPLSGEGISSANRVVLLFMHLLVGAVVIFGLRRTSQDRALAS